MKIIDAHHHIWRFDRTPWLQGSMHPRIFGDYDTLRRDYDIAEFASDAAPHGVIGSVYIQVNLAPGDEVWEAQWAAEEGSRHGLVQAVVAFADLHHPRVADLLDRQISVAPIRGIRQQLHWHEDPRYRFAASPTTMLEPAWQRGLRAVGARGLHFELQVFPSQFDSALVLVDAHPDIVFVLLHAGMPADATAAARAQWAAGLRAFALRPNVVVKLSGLGTFARRCELSLWQPVIEQTVEIFGPTRCLFGSNFPIEKLWTDYGTLINTVSLSLAGYSDRERQAIFHGTAVWLYRLTG